MSNKTNTTPVTYEDPVLYISVISSSLSILGSFAIFGSYFLIPEIRNSTRKLVTCLTVADFISAAGNYMVYYVYLNTNWENLHEIFIQNKMGNFEDCLLNIGCMTALYIPVTKVRDSTLFKLCVITSLRLSNYLKYKQQDKQ
jgi:hypothetical protein